MKEYRLIRILALILFLGASALAPASPSTGSSGFYRLVGPPDDNGYPVYHELLQDYTIDIPSYFTDWNDLPDGATAVFTSVFREHALSLRPVDWDFIRLERGGILTVKKGYRWDGATRPCKPDCFDYDYHFRATLIHDALYDLMRLGYLEPDTNHEAVGELHLVNSLFLRIWGLGWLVEGIAAAVVSDHPEKECYDYGIEKDTGDKNRMLADLLLYMISAEDKEDGSGLELEFAMVRFGGACRTDNAGDQTARQWFNEEYLPRWKFHPSDLTAYRTEEGIELSWKKANEAGKAPSKQEYADILAWSVTEFVILKNDELVRRSDGEAVILTASETSYLDTDVEPNMQYEYYLGDLLPTDTWSRGSNRDIAIWTKEPGNALRLDSDGTGILYSYAVSAISNDLIDWESSVEPTYRPESSTLEAWVFPSATNGDNDIFAFEFARSSVEDFAPESIYLSYCGSEKRFCILQEDSSGDYPSIIMSQDEFRPDRWHHVALTIASDPLAVSVLYVNGAEQAVFYPPRVITPLRWSSFGIGTSQRAGGNSTFNGLIDEARVWNEARTHDQIQAGMCRPVHGNAPGLKGLWHFDNPVDLSSDISCKRSFVEFCTAADATPNSNDLVLHTALWPNIEPIFAESEAMVPKPVYQSIRVGLDSSGTGSITADQIIDNAEDAYCIDQVIATSPTNFSCEDLGTNNAVELLITDMNKIARPDTATVEVVDLIPPVLSDVSASHDVIKSGNQGMVRIAIDRATVSDNCGNIGLSDCKIVSVMGNEPLIGPGGAGKTDYEIIDDLTVNLRATWSSGVARVYTIAVECFDSSGNVSGLATVDVRVALKGGSGSISLLSITLLLVIALRRLSSGLKPHAGSCRVEKRIFH